MNKQTAKDWLLTASLFLIVSTLPTYFLVWGDLNALVSLLPIMLAAGLIFSGITVYVVTPWSLGKTTRRLDRQTSSTILPLLHDVAQKSRMKKTPALFFINDKSLNAMAYSSLTGPRVALTSGLVTFYNEGKLSTDELSAILAHELGHISEMHVFREAFVLSWASILESVGSILCRIGSSKVGVLLGAWAVLSVLAGTVMTILTKLVSVITFMFSRHLELRADSFASHSLGAPAPMVSALRKIHSANEELAAKELEELKRLPGYEAWQYKPVKASMIDRLFETHPSIERRIRNLESTADSTGNEIIRTG